MNILLKALWLPVKHCRQVMRIFWPVFLVAVLVMVSLIVSIIPKLFPPYLATATVIVLFVYMSLLTSSGLIKWHKLLVRNEKARGLSFSPGLIEARYLVRVIILVIAVASCFLISLTVLTGSFGNELYATLAPVGFGLTSLLAFSIILRKEVLKLPAIALNEESELKARVISSSVGSLEWPIVICVITVIFLTATSIPFLIFSVVALTPEGYPRAIDALQVMAVSFGAGVLLLFYGMLAFTALLSEFYKKIISNE